MDTSAKADDGVHAYARAAPVVACTRRWCFIIGHTCSSRIMNACYVRVSYSPTTRASLVRSGANPTSVIEEDRSILHMLFYTATIK